MDSFHGIHERAVAIGSGRRAVTHTAPQGAHKAAGSHRQHPCSCWQGRRADDLAENHIDRPGVSGLPGLPEPLESQGGDTTRNCQLSHTESPQSEKFARFSDITPRPARRTPKWQRHL